MSNINLSEQPVTIQQIAGTFGSITQATNAILGGNPVFVDEVRNLYNSFLTSPTTIKILGFNPTTPNLHTSHSDPLRKEILDIKATITALFKAVQGPTSKTGAPKPNSTTPAPPMPTDANSKQGRQAMAKTPQTYASKAATCARPSVVVSLEGLLYQRPSPGPRIIQAINEALRSDPEGTQARVSATRWTARGNLVITAGPNTSEKILNSAIPLITTSVIKALGLTQDSHPTTRANVRWSRLLINKVPTGATANQEAVNPDICHKSLSAENLAYASLQITQRPSWVNAPSSGSSYPAGSVSSLSFAFEDPDGSLAAKLLSQKELYIFGCAGTLRKWKQKPPQKKSMAPIPNIPLDRDRTPTTTQVITTTTSPSDDIIMSPWYPHIKLNNKPPKRGVPACPQTLKCWSHVT